MYGVGSGLLTDLPIQTGVYITGWCGMQEEEWNTGCWLQMCCEIDDRQGKGNSAISRYYCRCHHTMKVSHSASGIFLGSVTSPSGDRQVSDVFASSSAVGLARLIHTAVPGEQPIGDRRRHGNQRTILFRARQAEGGVDVPNRRKYHLQTPT